MQFIINIDEKMFNESNIGETIRKSFESMSQEEKSSVMKDILKQYLLDSEFVKNYFVEKKRLIDGMVQVILKIIQLKTL